MSALHLKLLRDAMRLWAQVLAIALVMAAGVATLIIGIGTYGSLTQTREAYYQSNRFADVFAQVTRAPRTLLPEIAAIAGVQTVEARIEAVAMADVAGVTEPASVHLVSLPDVGEQRLNVLYLRRGRLPEPGAPGEAVISEGFAQANELSEGGRFDIVLNGAVRTVRVTGVALSPDFIYSLPPGGLMPDPKRYGIVWMRESELAAAYDLVGAFSNLSVKLLPGADEDAVIAAIDQRLDAYGGAGAFGRTDHISHAFLDAELQQLRAMSSVLPPIFLAVAAFLVNMTLSRLIALERETIGLLKALGYTRWAIALHYVEFVALIALLGTLLGFALGTWLGGLLSLVYARYYSFPFLAFSRDPVMYAIAAAATTGAAVAGVLNTVRRAAGLPPAVAMLPPPPPVYRRGNGGLRALAHWARRTTIMTMRHLTHWPGRTAGGVIGIASAVAILVGSLWSFGASEYMIDVTFNRSDRQDAAIAFAGPKPYAAIFAVADLPGVMRAEPFRDVPVRMSAGHISRRLAITGRPPDSDLSRVLDADLVPVSVPETGLMISTALAGILRVTVGDVVDIEVLGGDDRVMTVPVAATVEGYLGLTAVMNLDALNALLRDGDQITGANLAIDPEGGDALYQTLKRTPSAGHITLQTVGLAQFRETLERNMTTMISALVGLAALIAFGVIYNFARISLSEQGREMASLRVLGFTRGEVSGLLLGEIAVVVLIAQPLGWVLGYVLAVAMVQGFSTEIYRMPLVVGPDVFAWSSIVVIAAALVSGLAVRRRIDRLDMIAVLKTRE